MKKPRSLLRAANILFAFLISSFFFLNPAFADDKGKTPPAPIPVAEKISVLEPTGSGCAWFQVNVQTKAHSKLAQFNLPCDGGSIAWSADGTKGLVWFSQRNIAASDYKTPGMEKGGLTLQENFEIKNRLFQVTFASGAVDAIPVPESKAELETVGFNPANQPVALMLQELEDKEIKNGALLFQGKTLKFDARDGIPAVAISLEWNAQAKKWKQLEVAASDAGWDYARGVQVLAVEPKLGPRSSKILSLHPTGDDVKDKELLAKLGNYGEGQWIQLPGTHVLVWEVDIEFVWSTGKVYLLENGKPIPLSGATTTSGDLIAPLVRQPYLLLATNDGRSGRVFDLSTNMLVYSSDSGWAATFWPK